MLCLSVFTGASQVLAQLGTQPPCPNVISEQEAVQIAYELAEPWISRYGGAEVRAEWNDSIWQVLLTEVGGTFWLIVNVRADGRVMSCGIDIECAPDPGLDVRACDAVAGDFIDRQEAARIATDYINRTHIVSVPMQMNSAMWYGAHWLVWVHPQAPAPDESHFMIFVSPDGSKTEVVSVAEMTPSRDSFLFREPGPN